MKDFRRLGIFVLILYSAVILAAGLHIHSGNAQDALHCQLCQVSNISLTQTVSPHCAPGLIELGILGESHKTFAARETLTVSFGRAPPLS